MIYIYLEKAGVISKDPIWVCICEGYTYTADTLDGLVKVLNSEWKYDRHLVGDVPDFCVSVKELWQGTPNPVPPTIEQVVIAAKKARGEL